ncbi:MAG TPA: HAD family hydrolase [Burkholderiales bacterium]|nr:HAD family hydrolase [Burkholderiales bacterium]
MKPLRLAVWSGPRNISTAMMRAWENRGDCAVADEPLYAHYLAYTGLDHPGREEIIAAGETDWRKVATRLTGAVPEGKPIWYQKHMTHHLLPHVGREWLAALRHVFLIRDPREVLLSYIRSRPSVTAEDIGVKQQLEIFDYVQEACGRTPPVIDAGEFLKAPESHLRVLCAELGIDYTPRMLRWAPGPRASDGVWAPYWYEAVLRSSGFERYRERDRSLPAPYLDIVEAVMPAFESLYARRLQP